MQRLYLLLRNNRESGPLTYDELLQAGLRPTDLIWVEGKSQAWSYPAEIDALKHLVGGQPPLQKENIPVQPPPQPAPKADKNNWHPHVFVSLPNGRMTSLPDSIEDRAAALRQKIERLQSGPALAAQPTQTTTHFVRSLDDVADDYSHWMVETKRKKKKSLSAKQLAGGLIVIAGLAGGWWLGKTSLQAGTITLTSKTGHTAASPKLLPQQTVVQKTQQTTAPLLPDSFETTAAVLTTEAVKSQSSAEVKKAKPLADKKKPDSLKPNALAAATLPPPPEQKPPQEVPETTTTAPEQTPAPPVEEQKKKGFFSRLFGKKNKAAEQTTARQPVDLSAQVELRLKDDPEQWMMGIKGAKISLRNSSETALKAAAVELSYFSEQNSLLHKQTVHFTEVGPRKTKTLDVPDHRTAARVSYQLLSATGEQ